MVLRLVDFPHFAGKFKNLAMSYITSHGSLTPCSVPEKTKEPNRIKPLHKRTDKLYS